MAETILVFYGSFRSDRMGIRMEDLIVAPRRGRGDDVELIDAKSIGIPMLDRMYKAYPSDAAPRAMEQLAGKIRNADAFVFVTTSRSGADPDDLGQAGAKICCHARPLPYAHRIHGRRSNSQWRRDAKTTLPDNGPLNSWTWLVGIYCF